MSRFTYSGDKLSQISFPLGGIGTGSVGLSGTGRFVDWEIFNRPGKNSLNSFSHFAVKVEESGQLIDARVMHSDLPAPYMGAPGQPGPGSSANFGFGPHRHLMAGVPHFRDAVFHGTYPTARIDFSDETFPGTVSLSAYNPLIPLNDFDSSLPVALWMPEITNTSERTRDFVVALTIGNPLKIGQRRNRHSSDELMHQMVLDSSDADPDSPQFGQLAFSTAQQRVSWQENWFMGSWFDSLDIFWQNFCTPGDLKNRRYEAENLPADGGESIATLTARLTLGPGETGQFQFALAWYFPNMINYWNPEQPACDCADGCCGTSGADSGGESPVWRNYYATQFDNASAVLRYVHTHWQRLYDETKQFIEVLYRSSLPEVALEALTANLSLLRSPTCLRLTDGSFYAFEGCHCDSGCCEGSCTHVWNYAYALPYLFPKLERSMRDLDYQYNLKETGEMPFRLQLPLGRAPWNFHACVDGQMGGVMKMYREWQLCGDTDWLRRLWPAVRQSLAWAWHPDNPDRWDPEQTGVLSGRQHHTLDMELFGPNAWLTGFYLGALSAGSRMAEAVGDHETAVLCRQLLEKGQNWVEANLYNGRYYIQKIDLRDASLLEGMADDSLIGLDIRSAYWNEEAGEIKYQIGDGCSIDQVLAQWHSDLIGLDDLFDRQRVRSALRSIYENNYHSSFRHIFNPCRIYCLNDEAGTQICAWPEGAHRPVVPVPYSEETMHGFEYQAGIHMIMNGLEEEGLTVIGAVRDRYDGARRNPWNEFECGSNYARSMATYAALPAYSGFHSEMARQHLSFRPLHAQRPQHFFWSVDAAWGEIIFEPDQICLEVIAGQLTLRSIGLPDSHDLIAVRHGTEDILFQPADQELIFDQPVTISAGQRLCCF